MNWPTIWAGTRTAFGGWDFEASAGRMPAAGRRRSLVMIVMSPEASAAQIEAVKARLESVGRLHVLVMPGELTTAIGAIGDPQGVAELGLEGMAGVDRVVPISRPYKLASSELAHHAPTVLQIAGRQVGGGETFCLIAGPCTVESLDQTMLVARAAAAGGASMLRGGAFKPRTSPFAFKGLGAGASRSWPRPARKPGYRWSPSSWTRNTPNGGPDGRRDPDRRSQHAELRAARGGRKAGQAGAAQARPVIDGRGAADGGRLRAQGGKRGRDPVRAGDQDL